MDFSLLSPAAVWLIATFGAAHGPMIDTYGNDARTAIVAAITQPPRAAQAADSCPYCDGGACAVCSHGQMRTDSDRFALLGAPALDDMMPVRASAAPAYADSAYVSPSLDAAPRASEPDDDAAPLDATAALDDAAHLAAVAAAEDAPRDENRGGMIAQIASAVQQFRGTTAMRDLATGMWSRIRATLTWSDDSPAADDAPAVAAVAGPEELKRATDPRAPIHDPCDVFGAVADESHANNPQAYPSDDDADDDDSESVAMSDAATANADMPTESAAAPAVTADVGAAATVSEDPADAAENTAVAKPAEFRTVVRPALRAAARLFEKIGQKALDYSGDLRDLAAPDEPLAD
jgi:hypothetical protein